MENDTLALWAGSQSTISHIWAEDSMPDLLQEEKRPQE